MELVRLARRIPLLILGCLLTMQACIAAEVSEYELKAAYLYNFALFTTWPSDRLAEPGAAMTFCVLGQTPLAGTLAGLQARKLRERRIMVKQIASPEEGRSCHVLFIGAGEYGNLPKVMEAMRDSGTLTVTDALDPLGSEAAISMMIENGRLVFDVNLHSAQRARLTLSSKLLNLARSVH